MSISIHSASRPQIAARPSTSLRIVFLALAVTVIVAANAPLLAMAARIVA